MLELKKVDSTFFLAHLDRYRKLLLTSTSALFNGSPRLSNAYLVAVEAIWNNHCVGLALAEVYENQTSQLYSFQIEEEYRQKGIGFTLFRFLQDVLVQQEKCYAIGFEYVESPFSLALEKILDRMGWRPPKLYMIRCYYDNVLYFNPPWIDLPYHFSSHFEIFPWQDLTSEERKFILFQQEQGVFLPQLSPFREESILEPINSLGLRFKNKVIGWNITHRIEPDLIRYSTLYIEKEFYHLGYAIFLLIESMHLHKKSTISKALFEINLEEIEPSWHRFTQRRLLPYANRIEKIKWAFKTFL